MTLRSALVVCAVAFTWSSSAAAHPNSCEAVVRALRDAGDYQHDTVFQSLVWPDGYTRWPTSDGPEPWSNVKAWGPHPKYRTYLREMRILESASTKKVLSTKEITHRASLEDQPYNGEYEVKKVRYVCEKRAGQWRVFSQDVLSRNYLVNEAAARAWQRANRR